MATAGGAAGAEAAAGAAFDFAGAGPVRLQPATATRRAATTTRRFMTAPRCTNDRILIWIRSFATRGALQRRLTLLPPERFPDPGEMVIAVSDGVILQHELAGQRGA